MCSIVFEHQTLQICNVAKIQGIRQISETPQRSPYISSFGVIKLNSHACTFNTDCCMLKEQKYTGNYMHISPAKQNYPSIRHYFSSCFRWHSMHSILPGIKNITFNCTVFIPSMHQYQSNEAHTTRRCRCETSPSQQGKLLKEVAQKMGESQRLSIILFSLYVVILEMVLSILHIYITTIQKQ